ncbi:MAG TPA: pyridoxamine 5'-phosphate oxidase family protein [Nocardioides sp.]|uniref:pyridoxamine 5'-phosphate oxidase family protein n=1 Tax=uncultured Nocardioides sp. TaxID=198441 RepID=UPI000EE4055C|nr:pyridoxamine 5'-phosphate oxidase family protein [uncultured Nocardioides sp.]HCB06683.1 pyridoxamine 5'-phosphate oxidase family protein [Nocardioides sp.]HRD61715.1 pyridoxamine 5'-phosphate oxidase family protein [Nocardioides sp.]HRI96801.1 pyridoxamine 5'-phosphate oxidase family protein [Nocardioides sp.]HRK46810.1 pyridoxamine 5'-phosphate oxidase family protein [Nocardioides sp.]
MTTDDQNVTELAVETCWELLERGRLGRLAYLLVDEVHMVPINYAVDDGALLFRTASGNKLVAAALHAGVAFEIDWYDDRSAWSVVARGELHRLHEDEAHRADSLGLRPWVDTAAYDVLELRPVEVTGRSFRLQGTEPDDEHA